MKSVKRLALTLCIALGALLSANAEGWPANYEGVMLQGFYWDSYQSETKWSLLEEKADEYSKYFSLIWVPNSAKSSGGLGYHPVYWFTFHNSAMGSETQLRSMINTYKSKGVGIIADVVINHRCGVTNWTNFPTETWNGTTYKIGLDGICSNDEVANQAGQGKPTGAPDTGENYASARDLDHTNANVQANCKAYTKCLLDDFGYAGFRYDYCKGYKGEYNKMYNQYSKPRFSVGEYWDGSYDRLAAWIESTGKESAAFDFAFKYAVNKAFSSNNMTQLVWKANGTTDQPAGLIHYGYSQYAVTFIDNHDTYRDNNKFTGNVVAANAFMLCSPGTPCVFLPHYNAYKSAIQKLIAVRNACGLHNNSKVTVLRSSTDCYMAEVQGSKGTLVVKIGSAQVSPDGYTDADIKASGTDYCVWSKVGVIGGGDDPDPDPKPGTYPETLYLIGQVNGTNWATTAEAAVAAKGDNGVYIYPNVTIDDAGAGSGYFAFITVTGSDWDSEVNQGDRYGAPSKDTPVTVNTPTAITLYAAGLNASASESWMIGAGVYDIMADLSTMKLTVTNKGGVETVLGDNNAPVEYYNLQGIKVANPTRGNVYIRRQGSAVSKMIVR